MKIHLNNKKSVIIIFIIISSCGSLFVTLNFFRKLKKLILIEKQLKVLKDNVQNMKQGMVNFVPVSEDEKKQWEETKKRLWKFSPPEPMSSKLINNLSRLALKYNIMDISFKTTEESVVDTSQDEMNKGVMGTKFILTFHTAFKNFTYFLSSFSKLNRIIKIDKIKIEKKTNDLFFTVEVIAYYQQT
ncbi:MAG: type 4a pilus biogenesis protein PilO [bacterium]